MKVALFASVVAMGVEAQVAAMNTLTPHSYKSVVKGVLAEKNDMTVITLQMYQNDAYDAEKALEPHLKRLKTNSKIFMTKVEWTNPNQPAGEDQEEPPSEEVEEDAEAGLAKDLDIDVEEFPFIEVTRRGETVKLSMKDNADTSAEGYDWDSAEKERLQKVTDFLETHDVPVNADTAFPELEDVLDKFAMAKKDKYEDIIKEAEAVDSVDEKQMKLAEMYVRVLKKAVKNGAPEQYVKKEMARLKGILDSNALTREKKNEMSMKMRCMKGLAKRWANEIRAEL